MNTASVILLTALAIAVIMATRHIITHKTYRSCPGCRSGCGSCGECGGCGERGNCGERKKALQILE